MFNMTLCYTWDRPAWLVPLGGGFSGASTLRTDQLDLFPWDEAFLEHRHLEQTNLTGSLGTRPFWSIDTWDTPTCSLGTRLLWSIDTWDRPTWLLPLRQGPFGASTLGTHRLVPLGRGSYGASTLGIDQLDCFPWDKALFKHRRFGQTNLTGSLGTRPFWSIHTCDTPDLFP